MALNKMAFVYPDSLSYIKQHEAVCVFFKLCIRWIKIELGIETF